MSSSPRLDVVATDPAHPSRKRLYADMTIDHSPIPASRDTPAPTRRRISQAQARSHPDDASSAASSIAEAASSGVPPSRSSHNNQNQPHIGACRRQCSDLAHRSCHAAAYRRFPVSGLHHLEQHGSHWLHHIPARIIDLAADIVQTRWEAETTAATDKHLPTATSDTSAAAAAMRAAALHSYVRAVIRRSGASVVAVLLALMYIDRLKRMHPQARGEHGCGHRLFFVALMVANKYLHQPRANNPRQHKQQQHQQQHQQQQGAHIKQTQVPLRIITQLVPTESSSTFATPASNATGASNSGHALGPMSLPDSPLVDRERDSESESEEHPMLGSDRKRTRSPLAEIESRSHSQLQATSTGAAASSDLTSAGSQSGGTGGSGGAYGAAVWARISGVFAADELCRMEFELLDFLKFDIGVNATAFMDFFVGSLDIDHTVPGIAAPADMAAMLTMILAEDRDDSPATFHSVMRDISGVHASGVGRDLASQSIAASLVAAAAPLAPALPDITIRLYPRYEAAAASSSSSSGAKASPSRCAVSQAADDLEAVVPDF